MVRWLSVSLVALVALAATPAACAASSGDVAATQRYIQANYNLVQAGFAHIGAAKAALHDAAAHVSAECPGVADKSPEVYDSEQLSNEVIGYIVLGAYHTDVPAGTRFVREAQGLRWSSRSLTSAVQSYVAKIKVLTKLAQPDLCGDVRAWVASGYQTLPPTTVRFDAQFMPNWVALGELPSGLAPFERSGETGMRRRSEHDEYELTEVEATTGVETWDDVMNTMVLQP